MAYLKQTWEDRQVEFPMTFTVTENDNGTITLTPYPGAVEKEGTQFTAARMNNIENGIASGMAPTGCILPYGGNNAPQGWLLCDGSAINRTTYEDLFNVIGTTYGEGDGKTTFNLPDMKGKVPVGLNTSGSFNELGKSIGEETHTLTIDEMPSHNHKFNKDNVAAMAGSGVNELSQGNGGRVYWQISIENTGGSKPHNNLQPSIVLNYIIKT